MTNPEDYFKFHEFCKYNALSYKLNYWEADDTFEVEITSPAKGEYYYQKRVYDFNSLINNYIKDMKEHSIFPTLSPDVKA